MSGLIYLAATAFGICYVATPLVRDLLLRLRVVDRPDSARKRHAEPVPRLGGAPILLAFALSLGLFAWLGEAGFRQALESALPLAPAAGLIFLVGILDDLLDLNAWLKLAGQIAAASWLFGPRGTR